MSMAQQNSSRRLEGENAQEYLEQTGESKSLKAAVTAARFGLTWQKRAPFGDVVRGGGYLGISHDQNLNAWFDDEGVTIRPTLPKQKQEAAWRMHMRLKAYGYGKNLQAAPPIVSRQVKGNRIEYERANFGLRIANFELTKPPTYIRQSEIRNPQFVEWYENRADGIEQGFNIAERPERSAEAAADEPLRVSLSVSGDLRARVKDEGREIELIDGHGQRALIYNKLVASDANGRDLAARMETNADGREITLVVDDQDAAYPIVIDPTVWNSNLS